ncbi:OmpW/AlkL family protein [Lysobacter niastensis]|uniref:Outer membrane beta-barrel protein n=1 Tax=Lysobacter niastensis TaxID=380629 RepID=A0ABS0B558_9GAMM|nr:OmpW family outer membrane protein [Lysobacter niastensis]MBF6023923.1 outer membrane beta-barrel protein [Lysobacter niastensis]
MMRFSRMTLALLATLAVAPAAFAQDTGNTGTASGKRFAVVGGYALSEPTSNPSIAGTRTQVDGDGAATLSASWYVTDNIAVEAWGAADKFGHRVNTANGKVASVDTQPYALSGQYHFRQADSLVRPFVGLGYYEANTDGEKAEPSGALAGQRIGVETAKGAMATAGVDVNINPTWFARADVRYMQDTTGQPNVALDGVNAGKAELNPVVLGVGLGARF